MHLQRKVKITYMVTGSAAVCTAPFWNRATSDTMVSTSKCELAAIRRHMQNLKRTTSCFSNTNGLKGDHTSTFHWTFFFFFFCSSSCFFFFCWISASRASITFKKVHILHIIRYLSGRSCTHLSRIRLKSSEWPLIKFIVVHWFLIRSGRELMQSLTVLPAFQVFWELGIHNPKSAQLVELAHTMKRAEESGSKN